MNTANYQHPVILFDGICNLCNSSVNFVIRYDPDKIFRFASLQSDQGIKLLTANNFETGYNESILLVMNGSVYRKSQAVLEIVKHLKGPWKIILIFSIIPYPILNIFYDLIARYRYKIFGKRNECRIPTPDLMDRFL